MDRNQTVGVSANPSFLGLVYMQNLKFQNYHIEYVRHMHGVLNLDKIKKLII